MANHCYIIDCRSYNTKTITKELENISNTILKGLFGIRYEDKWWSVYLKEDDTISYELWLDFADACYTETRKKRCIEARHKPGDFMWWLGTQITGNLCRSLGGYMVDQGGGGIFKPNPDKYKTVTSWIHAMWGSKLPKVLLKPPHNTLKVFY